MTTPAVQTYNVLDGHEPLKLVSRAHDPNKFFVSLLNDHMQSVALPVIKMTEFPKSGPVRVMGNASQLCADNGQLFDKPRVAFQHPDSI